MRLPWQKTALAPERELTLAEKEARSSANVRAKVRRTLYEPSEPARKVMRAHHPALVEAETALAAAQERGRQAADEAAEQDRQARRLAAEVATGKTTAAVAEASLTAARRAALGLPVFEAAVDRARARVEQEERKALDVFADSIRKRRATIAEKVAKVVGVLEQAIADELAIGAELRRLQSTGDRPLLAGRDLGRVAEWPACERDDRRVWNGARTSSPRPPSGGAAA